VPPALAQAGATSLGGRELLTALRGGGFILYFRHADTDHRQTDARTGDVEDCQSQRNLTDQGREDARAVGQAIRALAIPIGPVLASPMCRTVETATLAFGLLSNVPPPGANTVIVGHAFPFFGLVGGPFLDEGQAAVVRPDGAAFQVVARVGLREWRALLDLSR
jgi:hypothetical protein